MCGIVGFISKWKYSGFTGGQQKIFNQLLYVGALRGSDATGIISVLKGGDFSIIKEAADSYHFLSAFNGTKEDVSNYKDGVAMIGHNRAKTVGENKDENAHPFVEDKTFAMVHNGTLSNHKKMHDTEVDSHALTILLKEAMDKDNWKLELEAALGKVFGAYAVVWFDQKRGQICAIRNSQRPLAILTTASGWVLSSEPQMGQWICGRNNEKVEKVEMLDVNCLYTWDIKEQGGDFSKTNLSLLFTVEPSHGFKNGVEPLGKTTYTKTTTNNTLEPTKVEPSYNDIVLDGLVPLSKNAFKKLRASVINRRIDFWSEDWVDMINNNSGECVEALIMGRVTNGAYDICEFPHEVRAVANLKHLGLKESDLFGEVTITGRVYEMEYIKEKQSTIIRLDQLNVKEIEGAKVH